MNKLFYISLLLLSLASCTATKRSASVSLVRTDSTQVAVSSKQVTERIVRDTVIVVRERTVHDTVSRRDAETQSFYREKTEQGLKAWIRKDTSGIAYGCNQDSFQIVVKNLIHERDSFSGLYRQQQFVNRVAHSTKEVIKEKRTFADWVLKNLWWIAAIIILLAVVYRSLKSMYL